MRLSRASAVALLGVSTLAGWFLQQFRQPTAGASPSAAAADPLCIACTTQAADVVAAVSEARQRPTGPAGSPTAAEVSALPPRQADLWARPVAEPAFARFKEWTERWQQADADEKGELEKEGRALAQVRRRAMADMITGDPRRALELTVPTGVRATLPGSVTDLLETRVNQRADLNVAGVRPVDGGGDDVPLMARWIELEGGETAQVFTYGRGLSFVTKRNVPVNGIALPAEAGTNPLENRVISASALAALSESPVRQLDADEVAAGLAAGAGDTACATSGETLTVQASPVGTEVGGEKIYYCGVGHAASASWLNVAAQALDTPDGVVAAAEGGTAASGYTQGYKRMLILRVDFPDFTGSQATISQSAAESLLGELRTYTHLMSYGTHALAPVGPGGSGVTPVLRMGSNASAYDNAGLSKLYPEARTKAQAAGFDLSKYDWFGVFTTSKPAAGYAGLAWVGGVGFHMANGYFGKHVVTHEFGHNLGLPHAHRWDTGDKSVIGTGTLVEYGNAYDPIGATYDGIPGEKHFVGSYKRYLDWIPAADAPTVTASGTYRLATTDDVHSAGQRLLNFKKDNRNYWIEFRQNLSDSRLSNGVFLQWANTDGRENYLLDARPALSGTAIPIGSTFTDRGANNNAGVHVTPVRKGGTYPESVDVVVNFGKFSSNRAPVARVSANTAAAPATAPVDFSVAATDADSDALAYFWEFGDGTYSTDNQPRQTHAYDSGGEYTVQVTVSDMKGGAARDSVVVKVDAPTVHRITGRVLDANNQPLGGIRINAVNGSETKWALTDSDGSYTLAGLGAKAWTLSAREMVADSMNFAHPFFTNPVTVGPSFNGADFIGTTGPQETVTPIVAKNATWKWHSTGAEPSGAWKARVYDDAAWEEGAGILGYNNDTQATVIPFGGDNNDKWTGYYFRRAFNLASPTAFPTLRLQVLRDDGVIVYLNGTEIFRDNMPDGAATYDTQAVDTTEPNDYLLQDIAVSSLPAGLLVAGTNVLAVEVHQASATSSDMAFDAALSGVTPLGGTGSSVVYVSSPAADSVVPTSLATVPLTGVAKIKNTAITKVEFFVDNVKISEDATEPYAASWAAPTPGAHVAKIVAHTATGTDTSANVAFTVAAPPATLVAANGTWKYFATGAAPTGSWQSVAFNDASWPSGAAQLGYGDGDEGTVIPGGSSTNRHLTSYFRTSFTVEDPAAVTSLVGRLVRDDGAAVYLNGTEVYRSNLPAGALSYSTLATGAGATAIEGEEFSFELDPALLLPGKNVLAAEVHQSDATSSDLSFSCALEAVASTPRPRGLLVGGPSAVVQPDAVPLTADVLAGGALSVTKVEFFADGQKIGQDLTHPFAFTWSNAPEGIHTVTAVGTDSAGGTITGNPLSVAVRSPWAGTALVSFGQTWKYLEERGAPAANWTARTGYDDSGWLSGRGRLGYGGDGEVTILSYGQESGAKNITAWFRKSFSVTNPAAFSALLLRLVRDDGAIVYLNGTEVFRTNMPDGAVTPTTLSAGGTDAADEQRVFEALIPRTALAAGTNVLAVEVHQAAPSSSDLAMDAELLGVTTSAQTFYLANPAVGQQVTAATDLPLSVFADASLGLTRVEYFAGPAKIGESTSGPTFPLTWTTPLMGTYALSARATAAGGAAVVTPAVTVTVGDAPFSTLFFPAGSTWRYHDAGGLPAAAWKDPAYDDSAWKTGAGRLGFGGDGETTALTYGNVSYYFRREFTVSSTADLAEVVLRYQRDDGMVVYLNGVEVARDNLTGTVTDATLASNASDEQAWLRRVIPPARLVPGRNVIAVEVHQASATSSDLGWDAELTATGVNASVIANTPPTVPPNLGIDRLGVPAGQFRLQFPEANGRLWLIECAEDLDNWQPYSWEFVRGGQVQVPVAPAGAPARYYRARWLPALP